MISPDGAQLGIRPLPEALAMAKELDLDLVEVADKANPPVCRIMDFGKYVYEEQKKQSHSKTTGSRIKEIEFTARIAENDFLTKLRHAEEFLAHGNKVKLRLKFRGRELAHTEIGFAVVKRGLDELAGTPGFRAQLEREFPEGADSLDGVDRRNFMKIMAASFALGGLGLADADPAALRLPDDRSEAARRDRPHPGGAPDARRRGRQTCAKESDAA